MLKFLQIILSITVTALAGHGLITGDFKFQPYMMLFLGLTMLVMGLREFQKGQKGYGWLSIVVFIFSLFVSIQCFLMN
ncbi:MULTISPECIES: YczI family protein [unclassified Peribacillus]|uniref:YczI family protein n=1 Tax=unclassified Peribacillus TaxID=2675266 RepID=UPI001912A157|nr:MULTISPECIES: YczI family protein [unclassified Peribacillus]MBK5502891.1 YczI family protein [Peribacillus sp. TH14]WMX58857.1 YczI family protein [Peribacillus sp. R9-11]